MKALTYTLNPFDGAVIETSDLARDIAGFTAELRATVKILKAQNIKVIWMTLPIEQSALIPAAVASGFIYHHAGEKYLEMTLTLIEGSYVPPYATHYTGAGGVVIDDEQNLLVIVERYKGKYKRHYKLPGGTLNQGEHISDAVCREVLEETGIKTEFQFLSAFRHWHGYRYGKSDIYFVCRLKPLTHNIIMDAEEIEEAIWIPVEQYLSSGETHPFNKRIVESALSDTGLKLDEIKDYGTPETHEILFVK
jgi:ADP-ribose pyrophosphatase YjhB (NUDIX family)